MAEQEKKPGGQIGKSEQAEQAEDVARMEAAFAAAVEAQTALDGSDALSELIREYAIRPEDLSSNDLRQVTGGVRAAGDRIWARVLEKHGGV